MLRTKETFVLGAMVANNGFIEQSLEAERERNGDNTQHLPVIRMHDDHDTN